MGRATHVDMIRLREIQKARHEAELAQANAARLELAARVLQLQALVAYGMNDKDSFDLDTGTIYWAEPTT